MQTPTGQTYASSLRKLSTAASTPTASWPPRWRWDHHGERTSITTPHKTHHKSEEKRGGIGKGQGGAEPSKPARRYTLGMLTRTV